ncbi:hypothetical protein ACFE04_002300 [Oxalis oulophora]
MLPKQKFIRIDTFEIKALIIRRIGQQRAGQYFELLTRFFSLKTSKSEFDRFCLKIIGRENIPLHNRLIRSITKNACLGKVPPPKLNMKAGNTLNVKIPNGYERSCLQSLHGDGFLISPRKGRSPVNRDRKFRDRPSPLGPLGKPQSVTFEQSQTELHSLGSRPPIEVLSVEDGEEVEQLAGSPGVQSRSPVTPPLGISINRGGSRKFLSNFSIFDECLPLTCEGSREIPDTSSLKGCLEKKLEMEGINVTMDCVNLLNIGLDAYLKRLIEPCIRLARSRRESSYAQQKNVSMTDFRAAMELSPQILGEHCTSQLEKICFRSSEE